MSTSMMHIAREHCSSLEDASCVVLGAGEMAQLSLRYLLQAPVKTIYVASRHYAHAQQVVEQLKAEMRTSAAGTDGAGTDGAETQQSTTPTVLQAIDFADRYSYIARSQLVMSARIFVRR